jgi:hypothetical protein
MSGISIVPPNCFDSQKNYKKIIAWVTGILTLLLALFSFILSFNALADLAQQHQVSIPILFPFVVEFAVVIFSLHALHRSLSSESAQVQWMLIIGSSLLAGTFNVAHAHNDILSQTMAAMPSLFLLLSFESFLSLVRHTVTRSQVIQNVAQLNADMNAKRHEYDALIENKRQEIHTLSNEANDLEAKINQARATLLQIRQEIGTVNVQSGSIERAQAVKAKNDAVTIEQRRDQLTQIIANEGNIGPSALAKRLNISRGTVYRDLEALFEAGQLVKDGHGLEVVR